MRIPTLPPTRDLPPMRIFADCEKGQTAAKTGCTPQEGGGTKQAGKVERAEFEFFEPGPGVGNDPAPKGPWGGFTTNGHMVTGEIAGFPIGRREAGILEKVTKGTRKALEDALSDPDILESMKLGGIKDIVFYNHRGQGSPGNAPPGGWNALHDQGELGLHPRSQSHIQKSISPEKRKGGLKRVIHHEAGHGVWERAGKAEKERFAEVVTKHPEIQEKISKFLSMGEHRDTDFGESAEARVVNELHAEIQAAQRYDPEYFESLPDEVKEAATDIWAKAKPREELPPHLKKLLEPQWK